jgi:hypothetical protein
LSAARVDLLLQVSTMADPTDAATWTIRGRPPTPEQVDALRSLTTQDIDDWETLVHLAIEVKRAVGGGS